MDNYSTAFDDIFKYYLGKELEKCENSKPKRGDVVYVDMNNTTEESTPLETYKRIFNSIKIKCK